MQIKLIIKLIKKFEWGKNLKFKVLKLKFEDIFIITFFVFKFLPKMLI